MYIAVIRMIAGMIGIILASGHIYLGTIGMRGAYDAMRHGYVDETWAKEHHLYWYEEVLAEKAARHEAAGIAQHRAV
jgi:formate dehydrogenase subunit gamma